MNTVDGICGLCYQGICFFFNGNFFPLDNVSATLFRLEKYFSAHTGVKEALSDIADQQPIKGESNRDVEL